MERVVERTIEERVSFLKNFKNKEIVVLNEEGFERVKDGASLLKDYFWVVVGHGSSDFNRMFRRDVASFYTYDIPSVEELKRRGFTVEQVNFFMPKRSEIFFDIKRVSFPIDLFKPQKVFYIKVNNKVAGVYFSRNRVLVATDWTHNSSCIEMLRELLPQLSVILRKKKGKVPHPVPIFTFGADPEFELVDRATRWIVPASEVINGGTSIDDKIGCDGSGSQVELRPVPAGSINKFLLNFKSVLKDFANNYPYYSLLAQGDIYPLGGHIHVSVPPNEQILKLLDNWIGKRVIDLSGSARGSYKRLSAYETKPWGFEYRTPPAAIFLKPEVLKAVLAIMKGVLKAYFNGGVALYPNEAEIARLGLEEYWAVLNEFIKNYPRMDKDVLRSWRVAVKVEPRIELIFGDDWRGEVKFFVKKLFFERVSKRLVKKLNGIGVYKVVFFGLKKERGEVCNFDSEFFTKIDFNYRVSNGIAFGFPWVVRMPEIFTEDLKEKWEKVIDEVVAELKKRVR